MPSDEWLELGIDPNYGEADTYIVCRIARVWIKAISVAAKF